MACQGNTKVLILIRHGQYETGGGPEYGRLSDKGREQAKMAGQHLVARLRADPALKRGFASLTSSAIDRAVETADIIEKEVLAELAWVDVDKSSLPADLSLKLDMQHEGEIEFIAEPAEPIVLDAPKNLLQPRTEIRHGSRLRISAAKSDATTLTAACTEASRIAVHQPLEDRRRPNLARFGEWDCSGCKKVHPDGDIHWSDSAEDNGLGFCSACFKKGPKHKRLQADDTLARITPGELQPAIRRPNDPNLNEADVDVAKVLTEDDALYKHYGTLNAQILRDHAQVEAAFRAHFHRCLNHKTLQRQDRDDVLAFTFLCQDGKEHVRHLSLDEFAGLDLQADGSCPWIWDNKATKQTSGGPFLLRSIGTEDVRGKTRVQLQDAVAAKKPKVPVPDKQVEVIVAHANIIRYMFLRSMQFDTGLWLNLGGSNCTMTQLRINRRGDVICDFFADHGSVLPVSHYTFNKHPDV